MRKKKAIIWIVGIIVIYISLCFADCIRLKNSDMGTKPLIVISENENNNYYKYYGLGYSVEYETTTEPYEKNGKTYDIPVSCEANIKLFGIKIFEWGEYQPLPDKRQK